MTDLYRLTVNHRLGQRGDVLSLSKEDAEALADFLEPVQAPRKHRSASPPATDEAPQEGAAPAAKPTPRRKKL